MKSAVITGATGAIGTALINNFISKEIRVLVLTREDSTRNSRIPKSPFVEVMYCSLADLHNFKTDGEYDVFYHLAWGGTFGSARNDMYLQNKNVEYALDAVSAAKRLGCKVFIGAGSQAEYGRVEGILKPDTPAFPENGYGYAKLCAGQMTRDLAHQLGLRHIWVRILSVYGPNDGDDTMVMSAVKKLKNGEIPQFTKGEQNWDYLYSGDAAEAFALLGEKGKDGMVYVLGSGKARPLSEYIEDIRSVAAPEGRVGLGAIPYGEKQVMFLCADISALRNDTGWEPLMEFKDGIENIINSFSTQMR
ncbi:MAG: NAD-dependent epimerase/dehydratase family protein [Ruminococcus sp.]|nr:NAD-dependent epimerase/dehydratase family protein [Ruminococcus sp.]